MQAPTRAPTWCSPIVLLPMLIFPMAVGAALAGCGEETPRATIEAEPTLEAEEAAPLAAPSSDVNVQAVPAAAAPGGPPPETARPYVEGVDAQAQIDAAVTASRADRKRVLLMFGANWCVWCRRLDYVFVNEPRVAAALREGYRVVHVDVGARRSDTNREVAARYGNPIANGLPCLVVLNTEGTVAAVQETGSLEAGDRHDPERVLAFLARWRT